MSVMTHTKVNASTEDVTYGNLDGSPPVLLSIQRLNKFVNNCNYTRGYKQLQVSFKTCSYKGYDVESLAPRDKTLNHSEDRCVLVQVQKFFF